MTTTEMMQAAVLDSPGAAFRVAPVPRPHPEPGQVLVRVEASAVNPLDIKIRAGQAAHARQPLPAILGIDLAGVVEAVGSGVNSEPPAMLLLAAGYLSAECGRHLIALGPGNGEEDNGHNDRMDDIAVKREQLGEKSAAADSCEKQCAKARRFRHEQQDRADDFQCGREVAEPLAKSDGIELGDHCRGTIELCAAGSNESKREHDF